MWCWCFVVSSTATTNRHSIQGTYIRGLNNMTLRDKVARFVWDLYEPNNALVYVYASLPVSFVQVRSDNKVTTDTSSALSTLQAYF